MNEVPVHLLPDAVPAALGVHPRRDVHTRQLLEEQLRRIRNVNLRNLRLVLARAALELVALEVAVVDTTLSSYSLNINGGVGLTQ